MTWRELESEEVRLCRVRGQDWVRWSVRVNTHELRCVRVECRRRIVGNNKGFIWLASICLQWTLPDSFQNFLCNVNVLEVEAERVNSEICLGLGIERMKGPIGEGFLCVSKRA